MKFQLGRVVATRNASESLLREDMTMALMRHQSGDWGKTDPHDSAVNENALKFGGRLMSVYDAFDGTRFWIITEADRSVTTILLPEDY